MSPLPRYALIVGVSDYADYDASLNQPPGSSDLDGAVRDALGYVSLALRAGVPATNIRLLLSSRLDPERVAELPIPDGVALGRAARAPFLDGLQWLAEGLGGGDDAVGMLAFAGHGAATDDALLLCGSDTTATLEEAVRFQEIEGALGQASQHGALTVFLEACYSAGARSRRARARGLGTRPLSESLVARGLQLDAAILTACAPDQQAMEMPFGVAWRGAFSLCVQQVLHGYATDDPSQPFCISGAELIARCRDAIDALAIGQRPAARGSLARLAAGVLSPRGARPLADGGMRRLLRPGPREDTADTENSEAGRLAAAGTSSSNSSGAYTHYAMVIRKRFLDDQPPIIIASDGHVFVIGDERTKAKEKYFYPNRTYWYPPRTRADVGATWGPPLNPFGLDENYDVLLMRDPTYVATNKKPGKAMIAYEDKALAAASGTSTDLVPRPKFEDFEDLTRTRTFFQTRMRIRYKSTLSPDASPIVGYLSDAGFQSLGDNNNLFIYGPDTGQNGATKARWSTLRLAVRDGNSRWGTERLFEASPANLILLEPLAEGEDEGDDSGSWLFAECASKKREAN